MATPTKSGQVDGVDLEVVLVRNLRQLLADRGWRHADLARVMREHGFRWKSNTPSQVLNLYRHLSLLELVALCSIFERPLTGLLEGDDLIETPARETWLPLRLVRELLHDGKPTTKLPRTTIIGHKTSVEEEKAMAKLSIDLNGLHRAAQRMFGTTDIVKERDRRVGDVSDLPARVAQAKRGHAMRAVLRELGEDLASHS